MSFFPFFFFLSYLWTQFNHNTVKFGCSERKNPEDETKIVRSEGSVQFSSFTDALGTPLSAIPKCSRSLAAWRGQNSFNPVLVLPCSLFLATHVCCWLCMISFVGISIFRREEFGNWRSISPFLSVFTRARTFFIFLGWIHWVCFSLIPLVAVLFNFMYQCVEHSFSPDGGFRSCPLL